ncbi:sensor histidine kinase [Bacteroides sp. KG123]|uniref:sensor histidine kinase n=1 Tax=unclassified Bacteroides TaxID=2646097 RepID=UPI003D7F4FAD
MERRIKIIWALSFASMILIVAGQGYWLWNQYQYKNGEYEEEIRRCVMDAVAANDSVRRMQPKRVFIKPNVSFYNTNVDMRADRDSTTGKAKECYTRTFIIGSTFADSLRTIKKIAKTADTDFNLNITIDSVIHKEKIVIYGDDKALFDMNFTEAINAYQLQVDVPFTLQRFDSVLAAKLGDMTFETKLTMRPDTLYQWAETVERVGNGLRPVLRIVYPYNPLKRELVQIDVRIRPHTLLLRMGWQFLGSLFLIFLLAVCLLLQIKTILKQRRIDELRKSFVNTMIHELKRPVQALKMCVAFLNDKNMRTDEQSMDEVVRDSMSELDNLSAYLRKLRDMTRADDEQTHLSVSTFDLKQVVEKLVRLQHAPEGKHVTFTTRFTDHLLVTADPVHISNIVSNLMENAVKYSGASVHILVDCALHDHRLTIKVADDGIGIPASEQLRVFDKFYRSSNLPDNALPGIGLGLSYVKLLVEAHRGTVSLTSRVGKGTTIEISIPQ